MPSQTSYLVLALLATSAVLVSSRPQESSVAVTTTDDDVVVSSGTQQGSFGTTNFGHSQPFGSIIGEIEVSSHGVVIGRKTKTKKPVNNEVEEVDGPRFSKFIGGPDSEVSVAAVAASPSLAVASGPALSISGGTITFNKPAEIVPIAARN